MRDPTGAAAEVVGASPEDWRRWLPREGRILLLLVPGLAKKNSFDLCSSLHLHLI